MNCTKRLNMIFTTHIRFTKKHVTYPKKHFCRCQRIELVRGHPCTPPAGIEALVLWIKVDVAVDVHSEWGGAPTTMPSLIICHFDKALANGVASMPIYEINISAVKYADKGLQCMICEQVGLIQALQIKFNKWMQRFEPPEQPATMLEPLLPPMQEPEFRQPTPVPIIPPIIPGPSPGMANPLMTPPPYPNRIRIKTERYRTYRPESASAAPIPAAVDDGVEVRAPGAVINSQNRKIARLEQELNNKDVEIASALKRVETLIAQRKAHSSGKCKAIKAASAAQEKLLVAEEELEALRATCGDAADAPDTPEMERRLVLAYSKSSQRERKFLLTVTAEARTHPKNYVGAYELRVLQHEGLAWYISECCRSPSLWRPDQFSAEQWQIMFENDGFRC